MQCGNSLVARDDVIALPDGRIAFRVFLAVRLQWLGIDGERCPFYLLPGAKPCGEGNFPQPERTATVVTADMPSH
jgi:hypothetical protein